jgi:hypothetical protein
MSKIKFVRGDKVRLIQGEWNRRFGKVYSIGVPPQFFAKMHQEGKIRIEVEWEVGLMTSACSGWYLPEELELAPVVYPDQCKCNEQRRGCALCCTPSDDLKVKSDDSLLQERNELREQVRALTKELKEKDDFLEKLSYEIFAAKQKVSQIREVPPRKK